MPIELTSGWPAKAAAWAERQCFLWLARRVIAIDLGGGHLKVLVADELLGRLRLVRHQIVDLQAEGLLTIEEVDSHLREIIQSLGNYPLAIALPQHLSLSHLVDLPPVRERDVAAMIERETVNLSGLSEGSIIYDYQRLSPFGKHANPFWVTIAREQEVQAQIQRLAGPENKRTFCEMTSAANALFSLWLAGGEKSGKVLLADLGATNTVAVIVYRGQAIFTSTLPVGSESFTTSIASLEGCSFEEAEQLKRTKDLFEGPDHLSGFQAVVEMWRQDLEKILREWEDEHPELRNPRDPWTVLLSGGGVEQPGLPAFVRRRSTLAYETWQDRAVPGLDLPLRRHAIVCGLLLQTFSRAPRAISLLPRALRKLRRRQEQLMLANWMAVTLVALLALIMAVGFIFKISASSRQKEILTGAETALAEARAIEILLKEQEQAFAKVRFLVDRQARTVDALRTLQILQKIREGRDLWFVLAADQKSYADGATHVPRATNLWNAPPPPATNQLETNADFVVELSLPDKVGDKFKVLRELVADFKNEKLFRNADLLPASRRGTNFFDAKEMERYYSLGLYLEEKEWQRLARLPVRKSAARNGKPPQP